MASNGGAAGTRARILPRTAHVFDSDSHCMCDHNRIPSCTTPVVAHTGTEGWHLSAILPTCAPQANYAGLPMHGNTAILVPDATWATRLRSDLGDLDHENKFAFVDARTGASSLAGSSLARSSLAGSAPTATRAEAGQIIVDGVDAFDGMERCVADTDSRAALVAFCLGGE